MDREKRKLRGQKRELKRAGQKHARQRLKRELRERPEEAHHSEVSYGRHQSAALNGLDQDTRRLPDAPDDGLV